MSSIKKIRNSRTYNLPATLLALLALAVVSGCAVPQEGEICIGTPDEFALFNSEASYIDETFAAGAELCQPMDSYSSVLVDNFGENGEEPNWTLCNERRTSPDLQNGEEHCAAAGFTVLCCSERHDDHCDGANTPYVRSATDCLMGEALPHSEHVAIGATKGD